MPVYEMNYDLTGKVFGHLTVLSYKGRGRWVCLCNCEQKKIIEARSDRLRLGMTKSCGCAKNKPPKKVWKFLTIDENTYGVPLTRGQIALIDKDDADKVREYSWMTLYSKKRDLYYAKANINGKHILMHRFLLNTPKGFDTDHKDRNTLNNRKNNLRVCTRSQNNMNTLMPKNNKSGYKGVRRNQCGNYYSCITINHKHHYLGTFNTALEASEAYQRAAKELHGEFYCNTNKGAHNDF